MASYLTPLALCEEFARGCPLSKLLYIIAAEVLDKFIDKNYRNTDKTP